MRCARRLWPLLWPLLWMTACLTTAAASAADTPAATAAQEKAAPPPSADLLEKKLKLLESMVGQSSLAMRIEHGGDDQAKAALAAAREDSSKARAAFAQGELQAAEASVRQGLQRLASASKGAARAPQREEERHRFNELLQQALSFRDALNQAIAQKGAAAAGLIDLKDTNGMLDEAQRLAGQDNYTRANQLLVKAGEQIASALSKARANETVVHSLHFNNPYEEYLYEHERNRSHQMLIDLVLNERKPAEATVKLIQQYVEQNQGLKSQAESAAATGDYAGAIKQLDAGTRQLVRALRAGGLMIPE